VATIRGCPFGKLLGKTFQLLIAQELSVFLIGLLVVSGNSFDPVASAIVRASSRWSYFKAPRSLVRRVSC
jgi:hypothetical protein